MDTAAGASRGAGGDGVTRSGRSQVPAQGIIWLCPEDEVEQLVDAQGARLTPVIDPRWGLEQIIARLAGFSLDDVTPFAPHQAPPDIDWFDSAQSF
jgi:hypothetical protein